MSKANNPESRIIVRLPNWVGDVCMSMPCLQALTQTGRRLVICGRPWAKELVAQFSPDPFVVLEGSFLMDLKAIHSIPKRIRAQSLGLILPDSLSSAALFALAGIRSAGFRDDGRSLLLKWSVRKPAQPIHAAQKWWLLTQQSLQVWNLQTTHVDQLQDDSPPATVKIELSDTDRSSALEVLDKHGLKPGQFILLAPTATGTHRGQIKVWPHFAELANRLKSEGFQIASCPPSHERDQARQTCPDAVLLDPLPLKAFCALSQMAQLVVCNDSGVSHLAAAASANQLTLFGVTDPSNTRPLSNHAQLLGSNGKWPDVNQVLTKVLASVSDLIETGTCLR